MVEARLEVEQAEFEAITRRLVARAEGGRGRVSRVPRADAEDVVQDAWEKAVKRKRVPAKGKLESHLQEALVDTASDYRRRETRRRQIPRAALQELDATVEETIASNDSAESVLGIVRAREILAALHARGDRAVELYAILDALGYTEEEIAEHLGTSELETGAIRKRCARMRPALREVLGHHSHPMKEDT